MTVVVAVLCDDGVVIGTDTSATSAAAGLLKTVEQPVRKIDVVRDRIIVAGTGEIGLGQRFVEVATKVGKPKELFQGGSSKDFPMQLSIAARENFGSTGAFKQRETPTGKELFAEYGALVAYPHRNKPQLVEFAPGTLQPEWKTPAQLWYASMGSGQPIADPFLGLMRRVYCPESPPSLATGRFMAFWTLHHTCDVNAGGIKEPIQLAVLDADENGNLTAREFGDDQLEEHRQAVDDAETYLGDYVEELESGDAVIPV